MKKVGLVTFMRGNYGSALQCYATKSYIESKGFQCIPINEDYKGIEKYKYRITKATKLAIKSIAYPGFLKEYKSIKIAEKKAIDSISKLSNEKINQFINSEIQPRDYSSYLLSCLAASDEYAAFITGSDQVWNCGKGEMKSVFFLSFCPPQKRIALSPSFGVDELPLPVKKEVRKELQKYPVLSVREKSGQMIIRDLLSKESELLPDPTILVNSEQWKKFAKYPTFKERFIFAHFLDTPSEEALESLRHLSAKSGLKIICFAYNHLCFNSLDNYVFVDGDPHEYVGYIAASECVFTDSFHTSLFSIYLNSPFYTFKRQYQHNKNQDGRLTTLLDVYDCRDRYITEGTVRRIEKLKDCGSKIQKQRDSIVRYLDAALPVTGKDDYRKLKEQNQCLGCGLCAEVCAKEAISFACNEKGYAIPLIDNEKCVKCGRCYEKCAQLGTEYRNRINRAFIAFNNDKRLREKSASGGIYSALAKNVLGSGGVVFGSELTLKNECVSHSIVCIEKLEQLHRILGSKYVQSSAVGGFKEVKKRLNKGQKVLFCGTSCQIDALYNYLDNNDNEKLVTVDLVCHGTPGIGFFTDYLHYIETVFSDKVIDFAFRDKDKNGNITYSEIITFQNKGQVVIPYEKSYYYRFFLQAESYRDACYDCKYASINKRADITLGDFFEVKPYLNEIKNKEVFSGINDLSCVVTHTDKGLCLLNETVNIVISEVDIPIVQKTHMQLCKPGSYSITRINMMKIYKKSGAKGLATWLHRRDILASIPKIVLKRKN